MTGARGASREAQGGVAGCIGRRWDWWGGQSCVVELTTRSGERVRATSRDGVSWAVDGASASFTACWCVSCVGGAVWVLDAVLDDV